jgi:twitching motility protein PilT
LIDDGHVDDDRLGELEKIAGRAQANGSKGPPDSDPFADTSAAAPAAEPAPAEKSAPVEATTPPIAQASVEASSGPLEPGELDFTQVSSMSDDELATALRGLLVLCGEEGVSDLHLAAGATPFVRKQRSLSPISEHVITEEEAMRLNTVLLASHQAKIYLERKDYDYALALDATHRYRVNLMFQKDGPSGSYRMVVAEIPEVDKLGIKNVDTIKKMLTYHNGLMLVTGPVGAGKTTTLAALVNELNKARKDHIITVEDPVEIVQESIGCNVTQRQVGEHTVSFATALKGALREDPDIMVIGELRDLETIEMAISASETGHLVIGTMHTSDASTTLNRLLDVFPPAQQTQIRTSVSESLRGVLCQRLLPAKNGELVLACEILTSNAAVAALIREGKMQGLRNVMETGVKDGMCLMENSVMELWRAGQISAETARQNVSTRQVLAQITG